ncbi:MAG: GTP-binding protein [Proteobacteria bacterium]|nr:GTP-binding protein [Pseudomonadota bacterium]
MVYDAGTAPLTLVVCGVSNSGKSTLINRLTRTERLLVHEEQGTTREAVGQQLHMGGREFEIFDTCGFVRRGDILQYLADTKTERLIKRADLALYLIDSTRGATRSDLRKLADLFEAGQNPLVVCSKSDLIDSDARSGLEMALYRQLFKLGFETSPLWLSSLTGAGVRSLPRKLIAVHQELDQHFATNRLTKILLQALRNRPPPTVDSRRIRLRMAHQGGSRPLLIVIHGKQTGQLDQSYRRFLSKTFRNELGLRWSFPRIVLSTDKNPYATPLRR